MMSAAALWLPATSSASTVDLRLQKLATYDATLPFQEAFKECDLATVVPADIMASATKYFSRITLVDDAAKVETGLAAAIRVTGLEAPGGGGWTGSKQLTIEIELYRDGKFVEKFQKSHSSKGHSVGLLKAGTCSILNANTKTLSRQAADWLKSKLWSLGLED
jgi:hypothetical protein